MKNKHHAHLTEYHFDIHSNLAEFALHPLVNIPQNQATIAQNLRRIGHSDLYSLQAKDPKNHP